MISLVKLVTIRIKVGAKTKSARIMAMFIVFTNCAGWSIAATDRFTRGGASSAKAAIPLSKKKINIYLDIFNIFLFFFII
jgi:hypothetical protein